MGVVKNLSVAGIYVVLELQMVALGSEWLRSAIWPNMPRRKKGGVQETGPANSAGNGGAPLSALSYGHNGAGGHTQLAQSNWSHAKGTEAHMSQAQDQAFQHLQEIFRGKVDEEVIYMVLAENDWKGIL